MIGVNINLAEGKAYLARIAAPASGFVTTTLDRPPSVSVSLAPAGEGS